MINVLKNAAYFTGTYFVLFNVFFWAIIFMLTVAQVFWKLFVAVFIIATAIFTFDHYGCSAKLSRLYRSVKSDLVSA